MNKTNSDQGWDFCCGRRMKTVNTIQKLDCTLRYKKCLTCGEVIHSEERWKRPERPHPGTRYQPKLKLKPNASK